MRPIVTILFFQSGNGQTNLGPRPMQWIAPSEKYSARTALEKRLWDAADQFRANSGLKAQEYTAPVLGLISLCFVEVRFATRRTKLEKASSNSRRDSRVETSIDCKVAGILYPIPEARSSFFLANPPFKRFRPRKASGGSASEMRCFDGAIRLVTTSFRLTRGIICLSF